MYVGKYMFSLAHEYFFPFISDSILLFDKGASDDRQNEEDLKISSC